MCVNIGGISIVSFSGRNGRGNISVPGVKVGDILYVLRLTTEPPAVAATFDAVEVIVSTDDNVKQYDTSDLTATNYTAIVFRSS